MDSFFVSSLYLFSLYSFNFFSIIPFPILIFFMLHLSYHLGGGWHDEHSRKNKEGRNHIWQSVRKVFITSSIHRIFHDYSRNANFYRVGGDNLYDSYYASNFIFYGLAVTP